MRGEPSRYGHSRRIPGALPARRLRVASSPLSRSACAPSGSIPYFYEDTAYYADCFDPVTGNMFAAPDRGIAFAADFFARFGFGDRWVFWDAERDRHHGRGREETAALLGDARAVLTLAPVNRLPRQPRQTKVFIDIDPTFTQIRVADGDAALCALLDEHDLHFTIGENIGSPGCRIPTVRYQWRPTRQPIATELWAPLPADPGAAFTTIGRWDERRRDVHFEGEVYSWSKRTEWMKFLELPRQSSERFVIAMDVDQTPGDVALLGEHGWEIVNPIAVSADALDLSGFHPEIEGGVHGRQGPQRAPGERLVQRSRRLLLGCGPTGRHAGYGVSVGCCPRQRSVRGARTRRRRGCVCHDPRRLTTRTHAQRAPSPRTTSTARRVLGELFAQL